MAHQNRPSRTRSDQLRTANPSQLPARLTEMGGLQAVIEAMLPLTARPFSQFADMIGGQILNAEYAGGAPLKAKAKNADGTTPALTIVNSAVPAAGEFGWQQDPLTAAISLYTSAADTQMRGVLYCANSFKPDIVAQLEDGAPA